jgi:hypothetical protein
LKPTNEPLDSEHWVREFSDPALDDEIARAANLPPRGPQQAPTTPPPLPADRKPTRKRSGGALSRGGKPLREFGEGVFDPFPPGYADDLLDGEP